MHLDPYTLGHGALTQHGIRCVRMHAMYNWETISIKDDIRKSRPKNRFGKQSIVASDRPHISICMIYQNVPLDCPYKPTSPLGNYILSLCPRKKSFYYTDHSPLIRPHQTGTKSNDSWAKFCNRTIIIKSLDVYRIFQKPLLAMSCTWTMNLMITRPKLYPPCYGPFLCQVVKC